MKNSDVFGYTLLIFGLGVVTGLLAAPRRGEETRKILIENIEEYRDKACRSVRGKTAEIKKNAEKFEESLKKDLEEV